MPNLLNVVRFSRRRLPHLEVIHGCYFVTVRCADSLPSEVVDRLTATAENLRSIATASDQFSALQRRYFGMMERFLDAGHGACPLRVAANAAILVTELQGLAHDEVAVPHASVMPNHCHAILVPPPDCSMTLGQLVGRVKGRSARLINAQMGTTGRLWQRECFDRWIRDEAEFDRCAAYIRNNPVRAGLTTRVGDHPWTW